MEENYGIYIIAVILIVWIVGVVCIAIDFFAKPKSIYIKTKTYKKPSYSNKYNTEEDSYIILDHEPNNPSNIHGSSSSYIFESMDDSLT